jgi:hypothetical protein
MPDTLLGLVYHSMAGWLSSWSAPCRLCQLRLHLGQPEGHLHATGMARAQRRPSLDPALARRAHQGEVGTCVAHVDLRPTAIN